MDGSQAIAFDAKMTVETFTKTTERLTSFGHGNVEAFVKSSLVWAAGCQALSRTIATSAQSHYEQNLTLWKALAGVKSIEEAMALRPSLPKASFETALAETGRITDASLKLAEETMAPLAARFTVALENFAGLAR